MSKATTLEKRYSARRSELRWNSLLLAPTFVIYALIFLVPVIAVLVRSLISDNGVSTENYQQVLGTQYYWLVLQRSVLLSLIAAGSAVAIGYSLAFITERLISGRITKKIVIIAVLTPLFTSAVVRAFGWQVVLGSNGVINELLVGLQVIQMPLQMLFNEFAVVVGLIHFLVPFAYLTSSATLQAQDPALLRASRDLGAGPWTTFWLVTFPLSRTALVASFSISFALAISSYVVPAVLGGGRVNVIAALIYQTFSIEMNWELGSAIAMFLIVPVMVILLSLELFERKTAIPAGKDDSQ